MALPPFAQYLADLEGGSTSSAKANPTASPPASPPRLGMIPLPTQRTGLDSVHERYYAGIDGALPLPTGRTASVEDQIASLSGRLPAPPTPLPRLGMIPLPTQNVSLIPLYDHWFREHPGDNRQIPGPTVRSDVDDVILALLGWSPPALPSGIPYATRGQPMPRVRPGNPLPRHFFEQFGPPPDVPMPTSTPSWLTLGSPPPELPLWKYRGSPERTARTMDELRHDDGRPPRRVDNPAPSLTRKPRRE